MTDPEKNTENQNQIPFAQRTFLPQDGPNKSLLVVCGKDEKMKKAIFPFLKESGCTCIFSLDKENIQKPLLQKATEFKHIQHAIAILTPDNFVYARDSKPSEATMQTWEKVAFELGFWTGTMGRENVATIYYNQKSFKNPTNTFDTFTIPFDQSHAWKTEVTQRLKRWNLL